MQVHWRNTNDAYGAVAKTFHWLIVALILVQFALGIYGASLSPGFDQLVVLARHKSVGITIFALVALRLAWRLYDAPPPLPEGISAVQRILAHVNHALLYTLLFALPVVGWLYSSATGISVSWFNIVALPDVVPSDKRLADVLLEGHIALAITLAILVVGHAGAALWHHFVQRDAVLARMVPWRLRVRRGP